MSDIYIWVCPNGHYFAMDSTGWLQPGHNTPPKTDKQWENYFEQPCPFCIVSKEQIRKAKKGTKAALQQKRNHAPLRRLYKVKEMELVTTIDEESLLHAAEAGRKLMRAVRTIAKSEHPQSEEDEVLGQSL